MNRLTQNLFILLALSCLTVGLTGCRNGTSTNSLYGTTRVQPPPTNWTASDTYYNPLATAQNRNGLISPTGKAPTPATVGTGLSQNAPQNPAVGASANPGYTTSGVSYTQSTNYQTTSIDETRDKTRIPLTDATAVQAPVQSILPPTVATNAARQNPYGSNAAFPDPLRNNRPSTSQSLTGTPLPYAGHPTFNQPAYSTASSSNAVLAESTVTTDTNSPNYRAGWRNNQTNSGIMR